MIEMCPNQIIVESDIDDASVDMNETINLDTDECEWGNETIQNWLFTSLESKTIKYKHHRFHVKLVDKSQVNS